eukprot:2804140-Alexandrium_andersonii.AAC.1
MPVLGAHPPSATAAAVGETPRARMSTLLSTLMNTQAEHGIETRCRTSWAGGVIPAPPPAFS